MKKYFEYIGLITLVCFSFFITEQTVTVVKEVDDIMVQIKNNYLSYTKLGESAKVTQDEIIPGLVTKKVNIEKSYQLMKEKGVYNSKFYIYDFINPKVSISNIFDKKISYGNKKKRMVSLAFLVENTSFEKIDKLSKQGVPVNLIFEQYNIDDSIKLLENNFNINILVSPTTSNNYDLINTKLKSIKSKLNYCYKDLNAWCLKNKIYTIKEKEPIEYKPLLAVKNKLSSENILVFKINDELLNELPNIIQYINSRGYTITLLTEHLSENW